MDFELSLAYTKTPCYNLGIWNQKKGRGFVCVVHVYEYNTDGHEMQVGDGKKPDGEKPSDRYRPYKKRSLRLSGIYKDIKKNSKAKRVGKCGVFLILGHHPGEKAKLLRTNLCRVPLCPFCAAMRQKKNFIELSRVMDAAGPEYKFLFLTLTMKNVSGEQLKDALKQMLKALHTLCHRKDFKRVIVGWFRTLEITRNPKTGKYHPHLHMLIMVPVTYAQHGKDYLPFKWWQQNWRDSLGIDYAPQVRIEAIKTNEIHPDYTTAVQEVTKYVTKVSDYLPDPEKVKNADELSRKIVKVLDEALHKLRRVAYGGLMKQLHKELNLDKSTSCIDNDLIRDDLAYIIATYIWRFNRLDYQEHISISLNDLRKCNNRNLSDVDLIKAHVQCTTEQILGF